jgi:hypothetical protein
MVKAATVNGKGFHFLPAAKCAILREKVRVKKYPLNIMSGPRLTLWTPALRQRSRRSYQNNEAKR